MDGNEPSTSFHPFFRVTPFFLYFFLQFLLNFMPILFLPAPQLHSCLLVTFFVGSVSISIFLSNFLLLDFQVLFNTILTVKNVSFFFISQQFHLINIDMIAQPIFIEAPHFFPLPRKNNTVEICIQTA